MLSKIKKRFAKNKDVELEKKSTLTERFDKTMEAITFAEAGASQVAQKIIEEYEAEPRKVLVVGKEEIFSKPVMDYALGFAERMGYEIVAVNVLPLPADSPKLAPYCELINEEFKAKCEQSASYFKNACEERNIPFHHIIRTGDPEQCIRDIHREIKRIEFVICDPDLSPSMAEEVEEGIIPVFCLANA